MFKKIAKKLGLINSNINTIEEPYDFDKWNPLGGGGERVDIQLNKKIEFDKLDMYQKSHYRRYEFATQLINNGDVCGDFACGTGYGSVMLSQKAASVIGADLDKHVIDEITKRYVDNKKVTFLNENLLHLDFENYFDNIISFETIEHFKEEDIYALLTLFNKALKPRGKLIFSTPYNQEKSEDAIKMGFHLTFYITEPVVENWLKQCGFQLLFSKYQNYQTHTILDAIIPKEFIIVVCQKN
jgi:2-polyprenyl-3-methyl-5-hydroxy-6-metoxy-1,4-benzoquinol methylase